MTLSCECSSLDRSIDFEWYCTHIEEFKPLATKYRRRCRSCKQLIDIGGDCIAFIRHREPQWDIEEEIYGDGPTVPLVTWYLCEYCGELYTMLSDLGFCMGIDDDMRENFKEYQKEYAHISWRRKNEKE